ncbi:MAG: hypothetical protein A2408_01615 [Candidatus Yonathbacteria bacterium RIFOXYC1_FULL_52_10]|uniref:Endonuclease III n=1 Tax=Candidatus Yonathbacteria bacterium RIFOXYD1_FULL_52_36 TaxID=1802730 RepID=A0A1G2SM46_9BACT|nr:MAG: hypothetical protein A2408_01615 [Candidatus Yonathbacteria bacterium RIFOXYC1_FULL_52_10]OHA85768.1 MAG: hypothetical protein A2591_02785 [Candidatus Yonathbacteria bacterium RIFOXYD1_FULL_52_36]
MTTRNKISPRDLAARKVKARLLIRKLKKLFPEAGMILNYSNHWELLVAVMLSAQCTDKQVNKVTATLFKKYRTIEDYAHAKQSVFERDVYSTGFYRNKAKNIIAAANYLLTHHDGGAPRTMDEMLMIPGVARKTANVVLGNAYDIYEGIAVDTHVKRLARLFGLTTETTPEKIECDLMAIIPQKEWFRFTYLLIDYGRAYCPARPHGHRKHPLGEFIATDLSKEERRK